jgi:uncharacterized membrane protein
MSWKRKFLLRQYWRNSLWIIPVLCAVFGGLLALSIVAIDKRWNVFSSLTYDEGLATALLAALLGATVSFSGFVFTMLLLVPQFSGSQLSARVLQLIYRDTKLKLTFGAFVGPMVYIFTVMNHMRGGYVPGFALWLAGILVLASILIFLAFISHFIQNLRPATAATAIAAAGRSIIDTLYPHPYSGIRSSDSLRIEIGHESVAHRLRHTGTGGYILALNKPGLVQLADLSGGVIVLSLAVGDYLANGDVMVEVFGAESPPTTNEVEELIALGPERTFEQDPRFAVRILVDIAIKALSPAINDPTTAVQLIDRIEDLLMLLVRRDLAAGELRDPQGRLRAIVPMPNWEEFLAIAVTEIRQYGFDSMQVIRRLRRMLEGLLDVAPDDHRPALKAELAVLDQTAARGFPEEADLALAGVGDSRRSIRSASTA